MALIPTRVHAAGDYAGGALMIAAAELPLIRDRRTALLLRAAGAGTLVASAVTDYELGLWRKLPMPLHLGLDAATGALMAASGLLLRGTGADIASWAAPAVIGVSEIAVAAVTDRRPSDTGGEEADLPTSVTGVSGEGVAAREPAAAGVPIAAAPVEAPGPSVTAPAEPASDVERAERVDANLPGGGAADIDDDFVAQQESAAAAEAASIGGRVGSETGDPSMDPVYEAGGGEQEGWEAAEEELVQNASHDEGHGDPLRDALSPEVEADRSTAVYGEPDDIPSTEVVEDPSTRGDDAGEGPGLSSDRGPGMQPHQD